MNLIRRLSSKFTNTYVYQFPGQRNYEAAAGFICGVVNEPEFNVKKIALKDLKRMKEEGNLSCELLTPVSEEALAKELEHRKSDSVMFTAIVIGVTVSISFNLKTYEIGAVLDKGNSLKTPVIMDKLGLYTAEHILQANAN